MSPISPSPLDSKRFSIRVQRGTIEDPAIAERAINFAREAELDLLIARVPCERLDLVQILERGGFFLCDSLVAFAGPTSTFERSKIAPEVGRATRADTTELAAVARAAFRDFGGHYHKDARLDPGLATEGYVEWCLSILSDPQGFALVYRTEGRIAGFITVKRLSEREGEVVLNGVAPEFQRRGIYGSLFGAAGRALHDRGALTVSVSTQLSNWAPQRVWIRNGLEPRSAWYTLHKWFTP